MSVPKNQEQVLEFAEECKLENGRLISPTLYSMSKAGKYLVWNIHMGIDNMKDKKNIKKIKITEEKYQEREELPEYAAGVYWTVSGQEDGKKTSSSKYKVFQGKNEGKKNFTTPLTQIILDARSEFNKKIRKGYVRDRDVLKKPGEAYTFEELFNIPDRGSTPWRVFAMALHDYKKFSNKINFPAAIQDKRDGTLFIAVGHPLLPERTLENEEVEEDEENRRFIKKKIDGYSRGRETLEGQDHILLELSPIAEQYPGLHFVGEVWKAGYGLQDISGSARRKADSKIKTERIKLNFNIFDCFYIDKPELGFMERQKILDEVIPKNATYLICIPTAEVPTAAAAEEHYQRHLSEGFEGSVIRNEDAPYEFGINREIRSYFSQKWKPREDSEWPVVGFKDGNGKEEGAVIWIMAENDEGVKNRTGAELPLEERNIFNVTPNQETDIRKMIFQKLSENPDLFNNKIKGQLATISYSILSNDYMPQQPKFLQFRNADINQLLINE